VPNKGKRNGPLLLAILQSCVAGAPDAIARQGTRGHIGVAAMTDAQWARARPVPRVSVIGRALKRTQEQFRGHVPNSAWNNPRLGARSLRAGCRGASLSARDRAQGACSEAKTKPVGARSQTKRRIRRAALPRASPRGPLRRYRASPVEVGRRRSAQDRPQALEREACERGADRAPRDVTNRRSGSEAGDRRSEGANARMTATTADAHLKG